MTRWCALSTLLLLPAVANAQETKRLEVTHHAQHTSVWCWAATAAMVVEYMTGHQVEDCEVLSRYDRMQGGPGTCCKSEKVPGGDPVCVRLGGGNDIENLLQLFDVPSTVIARPLSWSEVTTQIDNGSPIIARVGSTSGVGHVVVIMGYTASQDLIIDDPAASVTQVPYLQFAARNNLRYHWTHSWVVLASRDATFTKAAPRTARPVPVTEAPLVPIVGSADVPYVTPRPSATVTADLLNLQGMDRDYVLPRIRARLDEVRSCYERSLITATPSSSPASITLALHMEGSAVALPEATSGLSREASLCMLAAVTPWRDAFPEGHSLPSIERIQLVFTESR